MHVTLYPMPFAEFLDNQLNQLHVSPDTELAIDYQHHSETISHLIIFTKNYVLNIRSPTIHKTNLSIYPNAITINLFPVILYLTRNGALKFIDTFITLCHTTHPSNKKLLGDLYQIRQLITLSGET